MKTRAQEQDRNCWECGNIDTVVKGDDYYICLACNPASLTGWAVKGCMDRCAICLKGFSATVCHTNRCETCDRIICSNCEVWDKTGWFRYCSKKCRVRDEVRCVDFACRVCNATIANEPYRIECGDCYKRLCAACHIKGDGYCSEYCKQKTSHP